jgi:poly-gamma-glutamate capsule biosynthesis protein CapA/YwtB (metallophosphatase superfamily)
VLAPVLVTAPGTLQRHVAVALDIAAASCADIHATSHAAIAAAAAEVAADYSPEACAAADAAVAAAHPGLWQLLGAAVGAAAAGGHPVWHLPLDFFFCVAEQQEYDQVAAFFAEYLQAQGRLRQKVGSVSTRVGRDIAKGVQALGWT